MPRQPFTKICFKERSQWSIGGPNAITLPDFNSIIGKCITVWSEVEQQMAVLLSVLMKANTEPAIAVFLTLRGGAAQRDALKAAAESVLNEKELDLFEAIMIIQKSVEVQRNDLAHGIFGMSDDISDAVLWIESKEIARFTVEMLGKEPHFTGTEHAELTKKIYVYKMQDLKELAKDIYQVWKLLFEFIGYLRRPFQPSIPKTQDEIYRQLCSEPRVQDTLRQMHESRKNKP